jgi:hypothetical protein
MSKTKKMTCDVSGVTTNMSNFYSNHKHVKAVDNFRRATGAKKDQLRRMFNQIATY